MELRTLQEANVSRAKRWHADAEPWSLLEWAGAMCGEAGECANYAKKYKRIMQNMKNLKEGAIKPEDSNPYIVIDSVRKEAADAIMYAILVISETGGDLESIMREVFNKKSKEYGFPERI
jgi:NTP pyrophosphatase (non-canonical NTP hydrolase)